VQLPQVVASLANFLLVSSFCRKTGWMKNKSGLYLSKSLGIQKTSTCSRLGGWGGIVVVFVCMSLFSGNGGNFPSMLPCNAVADDDEIISCSAITLDEDTSASFGAPFSWIDCSLVGYICGLIVHWWDIYIHTHTYVNTKCDFPFYSISFAFVVDGSWGYL
jgi:hypothetical protein